jgi:hypothetical protein
MKVSKSQFHKMDNILKACKIIIAIIACAVMDLKILMVGWCDVIYHLLKTSENFELIFGSQKAGKHLTNISPYTNRSPD